MPITLAQPGVYIEEIPSGVRTITGVSTSTTAFVGKARKGPVNKPTEIHSFGEYDRLFGGLWADSPMSFAVQQYFLNGGTTAIIVRVTRGAAVQAVSARFSLPGAAGNDLLLEAANPGAWADNLRISCDYDTRDPANLFNLTISDPAAPDGNGSGTTETLRNLSAVATSDRFLTPILEQQSQFVRVVTANKPNVVAATAPIRSSSANGRTGVDGGAPRDADINDAGGTNGKRGIYALEDADIFNLLCIPPLDFNTDVPVGVWNAAAIYCRGRRAFLIVDPPSAQITSPADTAKAGFSALTATLSPGSLDAQYGAYYFPRFKARNLLTGMQQDFAPSGAIAGVYARTDAARGVWKAPAGLEAGINGVTELTYPLTDGENGTLNKAGVNCLRSFKDLGNVVWGSRTLQGSDALGSEWKYVPIRRLALYIEESLYRGIKWAVFEPNDEPLWAQIRLNVGAFMHRLFRQGAFQGTTPRDAYFVKCDAETTTQVDRNLGIVNVLVGFAPLKPAEFVVLKIQQMAGEIET
jgi:hypothetical protein